MNEPLTDILPLYGFFDRLRQNEFPLGVGEYEKLLTALSNNFGIGTVEYRTMLGTLDHNSALDNAYPKNSLLRLCKLLWLKPGQSTKLFEDIFEETYPLDFQLLQGTKEKTIKKDGITDVSGNKDVDGKKEEDEGFSVESSDVFIGLYKDATDNIYLVTIGVSAISLVVGGIGVMNIMLVSVTERTRKSALERR